MSKLKMSWTKRKPTREGAYWLKSFDFLDPDATVLVQVVRHADGRLMCNLHCENSAGMDVREWYPVPNLSTDIQWCGPLYPKAKPKAK